MTDSEIEILWNELYPKVFGYFYRRVNSREDAEDLTSNCMNSFFQKLLDKRSEIKNRNAYLWRIAHFQLINFIRTKSKTPVSVSYEEHFELIDEKIETTESDAYSNRIKSLLECIKKNVDEDRYKIVCLSYIDGKNSSQISQIVKKNPATIRKILQRALSQIRSACNGIWNGYVTNNN